MRSERKPGWYDRMKKTEPFTKAKFTPSQMSVIEARAKGEGQIQPRKFKWSSMAVICTIIAFACLTLIFYVTEQDLPWRKSPQPINAPEQSQEIEQGWPLTTEQQVRYEAYAAQPDDRLLQGLEPIDIFRWYMRAAFAGDFDLLYELFLKGDSSSTPSREEFLKDIMNDSEGIKRGKEQSKALERNYKTEQRIDGDSALIVMTLHHDPQGPPKDDAGLERVLEDQKGFGLTRNAAGVWKVNWMPMQ